MITGYTYRIMKQIQEEKEIALDVKKLYTETQGIIYLKGRKIVITKLGKKMMEQYEIVSLLFRRKEIILSENEIKNMTANLGFTVSSKKFKITPKIIPGNVTIKKTRGQCTKIMVGAYIIGDLCVWIEKRFDYKEIMKEKERNIKEGVFRFQNKICTFKGERI